MQSNQGEGGKAQSWIRNGLIRHVLNAEGISRVIICFGCRRDHQTY